MAVLGWPIDFKTGMGVGVNVKNPLVLQKEIGVVTGRG